jgi:hypothetical protein
MLRKISSIFIMAVFMMLQYGKVATYLYCKWQTEVILGLTDCDCDDHLVTMFNLDGDENQDSQAAITLNEKITEFPPVAFISLATKPATGKVLFPLYNSSLADTFIPPPFHPPLG